MKTTACEKICGAVKSALDTSPSVPIDENTGETLNRLQKGKIKVTDLDFARSAVRGAEREWFAVCIAELNKDMPEEMRRLAPWRLAQKFLDEPTTETGTFNKHERVKCRDGTVGWVICAWKKNADDGRKVDFFLAWMKFKCDEATDELLAAKLIHNKFIGYDADSDSFKYIAE